MTRPPDAPGISAFAASGAIAGALSALVFCGLHQLLISPIWFALTAMLVAGAISGACLAWSYALAVGTRTVRTWVEYNALFVSVLVALGLTSLVVFDPVTTIPALLEANAPPRALIGRALPMTILFTVSSAAFLGVRYRAGWAAVGAILITTFVIVLMLGMNISILGLVSVPKTLLHVIAEVLALILALAIVYASTMAVFWRGFR